MERKFGDAEVEVKRQHIELSLNQKFRDTRAKLRKAGEVEILAENVEDDEWQGR